MFGTGNRLTNHVLRRGLIISKTHIAQNDPILRIGEVRRHFLNTKKQQNDASSFCCFLVRVTGLEPAHREIPDPKSGASANYAIPANEVIGKSEK